MSENAIPAPQRHWQRPLKGEWRQQQHVLLWPYEKMRKGRIVADLNGATHLDMAADGSTVATDHGYVGPKGLDKILDGVVKLSGPLTIWLPSGWEHLVLTGLADLIDAGAITWRYCTLDANRVLIRGQWRGHAIIVTSLANWTGSSWDAWASKTDLRGRELFVECVRQCASLSRSLSCGTLAPSAGAAGQLAWRSWMAPIVRTTAISGATTATAGAMPAREYVAPIPQRPRPAREAERHVCYGLVHRQLRRGAVEGPIYCVDVSSCYLLSLVSTPLPVMYHKNLYRPTVVELAAGLSRGTGCALVQIYSPETPYPARRGGKVVYATGRYWTWLAGSELAWALLHQHVQECEYAYLWGASAMAEESQRTILDIAHCLEARSRRIAAAAWRSMYSHLVGRFAGWRREWKDCKSSQQFGTWAAWLEADPDTGAIVQHRSIAGRCQRLQAREDSTASVPLMFAVVTAQGRHIVRTLCECAGWGEVIAVEADSVWVTREGWQRCLKRCAQKGVAPDNLKTKEIFNRAWLTGEAISVVEINGQRYVRSPGIPADIAVTKAGKVEWPQGQQWAEEGAPDRKGGVRRHVRKWDANRIIREYNTPEVELSYADELNDPMLAAELLHPVGGKKVEDVTDE